MGETTVLLNKKSIFEIVQDNLIKSQRSTYSLNSTWEAAIKRRGEIHLKDYENMFSPLSSAGKLISDCLFRTDLSSLHDFMGSICIKNNDIQFAKEMFQQCSIMRPYILAYKGSHKICESLIYHRDEFYKTLLKKGHLIFQGDHDHFGDLDFVSKFS